MIQPDVMNRQTATATIPFTEFVMTLRISTAVRAAMCAFAIACAACANDHPEAEREVGAPHSVQPSSAGDSSRSPLPCCEAQPRAGCGDSAIEHCVCAQVPSCCDAGWDFLCAELVTALDCGSCKRPCCEDSEARGCSDPQVEACVCDADPKCCSSGWDAFCTTLVTSLKCGSC